MWHSQQRQSAPDQHITELQDFTVAMLGGEPTSKTLHLKAMETKGLVPFVMSLLRKHHLLLPRGKGSYLVDAGQAMVDYFELMDSSPEGRAQREASADVRLHEEAHRPVPPC
jgi:hypothetical protein